MHEHPKHTHHEVSHTKGHQRSSGIEKKKVVEPEQASGAECGFKKKRMVDPSPTSLKRPHGGY
jgi:hypothetical protein